MLLSTRTLFRFVNECGHAHGRASLQYMLAYDSYATPMYTTRILYYYPTTTTYYVLHGRVIGPRHDEIVHKISQLSTETHYKIYKAMLFP
jgi:hypothetical protein